MPSGGRTWWTQEHRDRQMCPLWPDCCITEERVELGASTNQLHQACTASSANTVACMNSNWSPTFKQMADEWCAWRIKSGSLIALRTKSNLIWGLNVGVIFKIVTWSYEEQSMLWTCEELLKPIELSTILFGDTAIFSNCRGNVDLASNLKRIQKYFGPYHFKLAIFLELSNWIFTV